MKALIFRGNFFLCGFIAVYVPFILSNGFIAENYTDKRFVAPEFFSVISFWVIGALLT
ncbi:hypothetical protein [Salinicoccus cyprini]|uniref:hypothetical protein n=1 Tax=Salinicoccus cyprini TaxID=2493691 RepID=UPI0016439F90|nr:hypothetical protein [Salinicoccus cyprini]